MGKQYPANWGNSPAGKSAKPGFNGNDTRLFSGDKPGGLSVTNGPAAQGLSLTHGGAAQGISPVRGGKAKGISLTGK